MIPFTFINWNSTLKDLIQYDHSLFCCLNCTSLGYWAFFPMVFCVLPTCCHDFLSAVFLCFLAPQNAPAHLLFSLHHPGMNHFSKEPCFLSWRVVFRNQDLGSRGAHCYWGAGTSRLSQGIELRNTYIFMQRCLAHIPLFISISSHLSEFLKL